MGVWLLIGLAGCAGSRASHTSLYRHLPPAPVPSAENDVSVASSSKSAAQQPPTASNDSRKPSRSSAPTIAARPTTPAHAASHPPSKDDPQSYDAVPETVADSPVSTPRDTESNPVDVTTHQIPQGSRSDNVVLASSEEAAITAPAEPAAISTAPVSADRLRADRLLSRARHNLERGYREEASRLAQIAERLELTQRVVYAPDEDRPSQFLARLRGEATNLPESSKRQPSPSEPDLDSSTSSPEDADEPSAPAGLEPSTEPTAEAPATDSPGVEVEIPRLTNEQLEEMGGAVKRFVRSSHRRRQRTPPVAVRPPSPVVEKSTDVDPKITPAPPVEGNEPSDGETAAGTSEFEELPTAPLDDELADLPIEIQAEAPPAPPSPRYWTWNRLCQTGLICGLSSLMLLWIWREVERWHFRLTRLA